MNRLDPNVLFFGNSVDASLRLNDLEQFREYMDILLARESDFFREAHTDLEIEFLPLFAETFPPILHSSVIISTAILLEQEMRGYSVALLDAMECKLKFNDLSGSILDRFVTVATKIVNLELELNNVTWQDIVGVFEIRNCLVHAGAQLVDFPKASTIRAFAARHGTPGCSGDALEIDSSTSKIVLEVASVFLKDVYDSALALFPKENYARSHRT